MVKKNPYSIIKYPSKILAMEAEECPLDLEYFAAALVRFRRANQLAKGYAIAAPQLGIFKRFFYYSHAGEEFLAINPRILSTSKEEEFETEGCLSVPGKEFIATRSSEIEWRYTDQNGVLHEETIGGLKARIVQHELDHLRGVCLPDLFQQV